MGRENSLYLLSNFKKDDYGDFLLNVLLLMMISKDSDYVAV